MTGAKTLSIIKKRTDGWLRTIQHLAQTVVLEWQASLQVLIDPDLKTGKIEALFTTSEETGLDGAKALDPKFVTGKILLNLDQRMKDRFA